MRWAFLLSCGLLTAIPAEGQRRWPDPGKVTLSLDSPGEIPVCRPTVPLLASDSIGPVHLNQSLRDVMRACPKLRFGWDGGDEAIPEPVVLLRFGEAVVEIAFADTLVTSLSTHINTRSVHVRTVDGYGPGSGLGAVTNAWGAPTFGRLQCGVKVWFATHPGMSFRVPMPSGWTCEDSAEIENNKKKLPDGTLVGEVRLYRATR